MRVSGWCLLILPVFSGAQILTPGFRLMLTSTNSSEWVQDGPTILCHRRNVSTAWIEKCRIKDITVCLDSSAWKKVKLNAWSFTGSFKKKKKSYSFWFQEFLNTTEPFSQFRFYLMRTLLNSDPHCICPEAYLICPFWYWVLSLDSTHSGQNTP